MRASGSPSRALCRLDDWEIAHSAAAACGFAGVGRYQQRNSRAHFHAGIRLHDVVIDGRERRSSAVLLEQLYGTEWELARPFHQTAASAHTKHKALRWFLALASRIVRVVANYAGVGKFGSAEPARACRACVRVSVTFRFAFACRRRYSASAPVNAGASHSSALSQYCSQCEAGRTPAALDLSSSPPQLVSSRLPLPTQPNTSQLLLGASNATAFPSRRRPTAYTPFTPR